jgi:lipopolysaccharide/colanic/teichoic acid biosynthesis glycosyltransferase
MQKLKTKLIIFIFMTLTCFVGVTKAWGDLSIVKPNDSAEYQQRKSKAPEPSTLALFGSGFVGMIISFVRRTYALAKRMIDIIGSVVALIVLFPACLFAVFIIKLCSRGSVIYTQTRVGKGGREFKIYKFRTMHLNAEKETGPVWAKETDKRLIPGGQFLRKAHIDEIPQFINVLKGDMSIVGPRPERPTFVKQLKQAVPDYERRLAVKPGITGLAQVWHCYDETIRDVKKKVKYDLLYIRKICFLTDFLIMLRTVRVVFTGEGAR